MRPEPSPEQENVTSAWATHYSNNIRFALFSETNQIRSIFSVEINNKQSFDIFILLFSRLRQKKKQKQSWESREIEVLSAHLPLRRRRPSSSLDDILFIAFGEASHRNLNMIWRVDRPLLCGVSKCKCSSVCSTTQQQWRWLCELRSAMRAAHNCRARQRKALKVGFFSVAVLQRARCCQIDCRFVDKSQYICDFFFITLHWEEEKKDASIHALRMHREKQS